MVQLDTTIKGEAGADASLGRIDKFELLRELGEGGFGAVYLARDTVAGVDVAIKGLPPEVKHNKSELENIRENFALVKRLRHPNIVAVTDLHEAQSVSYANDEVRGKLRVFERDTMVVMDYAPGATLFDWRKQFPGKIAPPEKALEIVGQIANALDYAHGRKVLHRDIKPANIIVETADGVAATARVLDFGLAAEIRSSMGRVSKEIRDTSGSRPYMAPEQWRGERQGPATDQYALAVLLYELVTGEVPFASVFDCGDTAVMRLAVTTDAPKIPASLPKNMRKALAVALAKKPEDRFASCCDFVAAAEGKRVSRRGGRTGGGMAALVAAALAVTAAIGGAWWFAGRDATSAGHGQPVEPAPPAAPSDTNNVTQIPLVVSNAAVPFPDRPISPDVPPPSTNPSSAAAMPQGDGNNINTASNTRIKNIRHNKADAAREAALEAKRRVDERRFRFSPGSRLADAWFTASNMMVAADGEYATGEYARAAAAYRKAEKQFARILEKLEEGKPK